MNICVSWYLWEMIKSNKVDRNISSTLIVGFNDFYWIWIDFWRVGSVFGSDMGPTQWIWIWHYCYLLQPNPCRKISAFHEVVGNTCLALSSSSLILSHRIRGRGHEVFKFVHPPPRKPQLHIPGEKSLVLGVVRNLQVCRFFSPNETQGVSRNLDQILPQWQDLDLG